MKINGETIWLIIGFSGQILFCLRFVVQWLESEKKQESFIPEIFWYFSISGGLFLLAYAIYKKDPVFILGQGIGLLMYCRNLMLIARVKTKNS